MDRSSYNENYPLENCNAKKEIYTREEILHMINERISKYERLTKKCPSQRRQFGDKIDELITISTLFF